MEYKVPKKNIILAVSIFLVVILSVGGLFYINIKKHASVTIKATVKYIGADYIIVEDEQKEEYSLKTENDYNVGDQISFVIKDIKKDTDPKEGTVERIDTISKSVTFIIMDSSGEEIPEQSNSETSIENIDTNHLDSSQKEDVLEYFETLNQKMNMYSTDKTIGESLKNGFVTIIDFLFYDGKIYGKTFHELSDGTKLQILSLALSIDQKIEEYFPDYKEQISSTGGRIYTNMKEKILSYYLDITTSVCEQHSDLCTSARDALASLKKNFSLTWDMIKDMSGVGLSKLKAWYEVWKDAK